jgi:quinol monooxygenase YgiN
VILIVVRFPVQAEHADCWPHHVEEFTAATRAEPGCLFFDWSRSADDPHQWMLVEAFTDEAAGGRHVQSDHFAAAMHAIPAYITAVPQIINVNVPDHPGFGPMAELSPAR